MAKSKKKSIEERALEFATQRDRHGEDPFTDAEILEILKRIRDGALFWMEQCVMTASSRGIGGAQVAYERSTQEIERIDARAMVLKEHRENAAMVIGYEMELPTKPAPVAEA